MPGAVMFKQTETTFDVAGNRSVVEGGGWLLWLASYVATTVHEFRRNVLTS